MRLQKLSQSLAFIGTLSFAQDSLPSKGAASTPPAVDSFVLRVNNMMCGSCTSRVKKVIQSQPGTSDVTVNLTDHEARFSCLKGKGCDVEKITKNLSKIGYPAKVASGK